MRDIGCKDQLRLKEKIEKEGNITCRRKGN